MINIRMQPTATAQRLSPKITVIGVGGAGGNAVNNMISSNLEGCEFLVCNTDSQAIANSLCDNKIQLGEHVTGGLGAGAKPEVGKAAAEETLEEVLQFVDGANMAFITAGMGGGTGTGAAPVIAKACRELGILTIGVVTKPFHFEGTHRMKMAEEGIRQLQAVVDTLIVIPNQNLFRVANEKTTFAESFQMADSVLQSGVRGVTDLMVRPGLVNLDFADIRTAMSEMGKAMMGTGEASGDKRAIEAAEAAINNPLLDDVSMKGAHGVIINVTGGYDMTLFEADEACNRIRDEVDPNANIIFGATFDDKMEGKMRVSIVATGIEKEADQKTKPGSGTGTMGGNKPAGKPIQQVAKTVTGGQPQNIPLASSQTAPITPSSLQATRPVYTPAAAQVAPQQQAAPVQQAPKAPEPEADLFEQQQFSAPTAETAQGETPQNTALRGTRYKNSFIPPKPAQIGANPGFHAQQAQQQPYPGQPVARPQMEETVAGGYAPQPQYQEQQTQNFAPPQQAASYGGLKLNPPKLPMPGKRAPSLFERISDSVQQRIGNLASGHREPQQGYEQAEMQQQQQQYAPRVPQNPSQGSLNIDAPAAPKRAEDDLDIPAFLRRQAN